MGNRHFRRLTAVVACSVLLAGCNAYRDDHFGFSFGFGGWYGHHFQVPTQDIVKLDAALPGGTIETVRWIRRNVNFHDIPGDMVLDFSYFFDDENAGDLAESIGQVRNNRKCLLMHRNPFTWGDRHNWTEEDPGGDCAVGRSWVQ